jgi:hypothetical protein
VKAHEPTSEPDRQTLRGLTPAKAGGDP